MFPSRLVLLSLAVAQTLLGQELRVEYPELRLADKRVLGHPTVESFNGLGFCIAHDKGIEAFVRWEIMPADWQKAFPRDPQKALALADKARTEELKHPPPPIDLKKTTGHAPAAPVSDGPGTAVNEGRVTTSKKVANKIRPRSDLEELKGQKADAVRSKFGPPDSTNDTSPGGYHFGAQAWHYHRITMNPVSNTEDETTTVIVTHDIEFSRTGSKEKDDWIVWSFEYN